MTNQSDSKPLVLGSTDNIVEKEIIRNPIPQKTSVLVLKTIAGLVLIAVALTLIFNGLKNLSSNTDDEINKTDNLIEQSMNEIKDSDFSDNLEIEFNDSSVLPPTNQIDQVSNDIENILKDLNNQSDFKDIETIDFN